MVLLMDSRDDPNMAPWFLPLKSLKLMDKEPNKKTRDMKRIEQVPSRKRTDPTLAKGKSSSKVPF